MKSRRATVSTSAQALAFVKRHGVVLESARGPVPNLAEAIAGGAIRGSWWGHPKGHLIFELLNAVRDSPDVAVGRFVGGKVTFVHRRLWPALVRLAAMIGAQHLAVVREEHTASGAHRVVTTPFPRWVPADVRAAAARLSETEAQSLLGLWVPAPQATRRPLRR